MRNRRVGTQHVLNAVQVNSMVMLVWLHVNFARKTRITAKKVETTLASIVHRVGRLKTAV
jgi:hypothetical protein